MVCSILYWGLSCRFPPAVPGLEHAASAVLLQSLHSPSVCGSADQQDTGDIVKIRIYKYAKENIFVHFFFFLFEMTTLTVMSVIMIYFM